MDRRPLEVLLPSLRIYTAPFYGQSLDADARGSCPATVLSEHRVAGWLGVRHAVLVAANAE